MEIKKLKLLVLLFLTSTLLAGINQLGIEDNSMNNNNPQTILEAKNSKVILGSLVIMENSDTKMNLTNFDKVGSFYFQKKPTKEMIKSRELEIYNNKNINAATITYKLVEAAGNRHMISDGSFIVGFKDISDRKRFAEDFNLIAKSNFDNKTAFLTKGFNNFENMIDDIKADSRVLSFELDLINPNLRTR